MLSLVILADLRRGGEPDEDVFQVGRFESRLTVPICKLIRRLDSEGAEDHSLPVILARAQISALRTSGNADRRYGEKWTLIRGLYDLGSNKGRELFRLINMMMHLRPDLEERSERELIELDEELEMPFVTSIERVVMARTLLPLVEKKCKSLRLEAEERIKALSSQDLEKPGLALLDFQSLEDLTKWLDQHAPAEGES